MLGNLLARAVARTLHWTTPLTKKSRFTWSFDLHHNKEYRDWVNLWSWVSWVQTRIERSCIERSDRRAIARIVPDRASTRGTRQSLMDRSVRPLSCNITGRAFGPRRTPRSCSNSRSTGGGRPRQVADQKTAVHQSARKIAYSTATATTSAVSARTSRTHERTSRFTASTTSVAVCSRATVRRDFVVPVSPSVRTLTARPSIT